MKTLEQLGPVLSDVWGPRGSGPSQAAPITTDSHCENYDAFDSFGPG
jgi:hypothetical protein